MKATAVIAGEFKTMVYKPNILKIIRNMKWCH
jgi:hypothetical protein